MKPDCSKLLHPRSPKWVSAAAILVTLFVAASPSSADEKPVPAAPNACAEERCLAIRSSAEMKCSVEAYDPEVCDVVLAELQKCDDACLDTE